MSEIDFEPESPHVCLGRSKSLQDLEQLKPWQAVLDDIRSYGTHLLPRALDSSDRAVEDLVVLGALFRQFLVFLDATTELVRVGAIQASWHQLRGLWEARLQLLWIFRNDSNARARQFYVSDLRQQRRDHLARIDGTPENQQQASARARFNIVAHHPSSPEAAQLQSKIQRIDGILAGARFASIDNEYGRLRGNRSFDVHWFEPFTSIRSIKELAKDSGLEAEYELLYSPMSRVSHVRQFSGQMEFSGNSFSIVPITVLLNTGDLLTLTYSFSIEVFKRILERYRSGEEAAFSRRYTERWEHRTMNIPAITYGPAESSNLG